MYRVSFRIWVEGGGANPPPALLKETLYYYAQLKHKHPFYGDIE